MKNFVPNELKTFSPRDPEWLNGNIKNFLRRQNKLQKKYKRNGFKDEDKVLLDKIKAECLQAIQSSKESFLRKQGHKLANPATGQKTYWKILNGSLNKCKVSRIPPLFIGNSFITNCKEKATYFNDYFVSQCTPFENSSVLPSMQYLTDRRLSGFEVSPRGVSKSLYMPI